MHQFVLDFWQIKKKQKTVEVDAADLEQDLHLSLAT